MLDFRVVRINVVRPVAWCGVLGYEYVVRSLARKGESLRGLLPFSIQTSSCRFLIESFVCQPPAVVPNASTASQSLARGLGLGLGFRI